MITQTVGNLLQDQVTLNIECIDWLYLNAYQPRLQTGAGVAFFFQTTPGCAGGLDDPDGTHVPGVCQAHPSCCPGRGRGDGAV